MHKVCAMCARLWHTHTNALDHTYTQYYGDKMAEAVVATSDNCNACKPERAETETCIVHAICTNVRRSEGNCLDHHYHHYALCLCGSCYCEEHLFMTTWKQVLSLELAKGKWSLYTGQLRLSQQKLKYN